MYGGTCSKMNYEQQMVFSQILRQNALDGNM